MRYETVVVRHGENVGPVDWEHPSAKDCDPAWREAERTPEKFRYNGREIIQVCMYDGWPFWEPRPAVMFVGPLGSGEWDFFNSYGFCANSLTKREVR